MVKAIEHLKLTAADLRWRLDPATLPFETTEEVEPLKEILGQKRGVDAFRFGMGLNKPGYNVFVTGAPGSGRMSSVKKLLEEISHKEKAPDDLCYVNNFHNPEAPILLRFRAGDGTVFKKKVHDFVEAMKTEIPQIFEGQEYLARKSEVMEAYEKKTREFFKELDRKVKETGFALVNIQTASGMQRPELMPIIDGEPVPMMKLEELVEKERFPRQQYEDLKRKYTELKQEVDQIFIDVREMQKELKEKSREMDRLMFTNTASDRLQPVFDLYSNSEPVTSFLNAMLEDMADNLDIFTPQPSPQGFPPGLVHGDPFMPYKVNLLVDNSEQKSPPVIIESYPTYRNLFGSIERVIDRSGVWRTDFSKIKAGSFLKANGGYLVINLIDALTEPGVWPALKRALKTEKMEIQTFDPMYWFTSTGLKPEPIPLEVKVVVLADPRIYHLLNYYDEDAPKIFKVRADFDMTMDRTDDSAVQLAQFIRMRAEKDNLRPFDRSAVAELVEHLVRVAGRREKLSARFPLAADILLESDYFAAQDNAEVVSGKHVEQALEARIYRSNLVEEKIQEMIDRGSLFIDTDGAVVGQVNGLAVFGLGNYSFGKPSRITATTSMGKEGVINIEREAEMSGSLHNKGVLILSGYLRKKFAQNKPLTVSASIAFEQSYGGIDGDSASSTEIYALLSSLSGIPIKQFIAVTGSVNQKGEIQPIGGVNEKIEGFFECCKHAGLTGEQGVIIPAANVKDLMLKKEVVDAVNRGRFHVWSVSTIEDGIEILTGTEAGKRREDGSYPEGSVFALADARLRELAEGLKKFGTEEEKEEKGGQKPQACACTTKALRSSRNRLAAARRLAAKRR